MTLESNEMISHSAYCNACDKRKKGILLDDDERYEKCDCGGELTDHQARMQRMDDKGVWKEAGPMKWEGGLWVMDE